MCNTRSQASSQTIVRKLAGLQKTCAKLSKKSWQHSRTSPMIRTIQATGRLWAHGTNPQPSRSLAHEDMATAQSLIFGTPGARARIILAIHDSPTSFFGSKMDAGNLMTCTHSAVSLRVLRV